MDTDTTVKKRLTNENEKVIWKDNNSGRSKMRQEDGGVGEGRRLHQRVEKGEER